MEHRHSEVKVGCYQLAPRVGELVYNRHLSEAAIRTAAGQGVKIVVLPELVQSGYVFIDKAHALTLAEPLDGPTLSLWTALARELEIVIVAGFCELQADGQLANSAVLIDATGLRAVYRKVHLWDREKQVFTPGDQAPPLVETCFGRIAVMICYDLEFPEWARLAALAGADLLCAPVNWPDSQRPPGERPAEVVRVQANASVNRMFIAVCGRTGIERGIGWVGGSVIVDPDGYPLAGPLGADEEGMICASLNLADARNKRISEHNDVHADRRPTLYESLRPNV